VSTLPAPSEDLGDFPAHRLQPDQTLFRIHQAVHGPWWFGGGGEGRFDLSRPNGTCYLAESSLGAFVEALRRAGIIIPWATVQERRISLLHVPEPVLLADCTDSRVRRFGLTGEIHTAIDRAVTQRWADALAKAGFRGIRYLVRHDPSQREAGIALFGPRGEAQWPVVSTEMIGAELLLEVERRFGIFVQRETAMS
jgi:hypothetical protein